DVLAFETGELLRDEERLRQKSLNLARARYRQLVVFRELVDAENRDDVLEILVPLQDLFHLPRNLIMLLADDARVENARGRRERIDGRIDPELRELQRQVSRRVQMCRGGRRRWR